MPSLLWLLPALALLPLGWFAAAWHYQRKIMNLQRQVLAVRQTAAEHAAQARRQVGQLQADLAEARSARAPAPAPQAHGGPQAQAGAQTHATPLADIDEQLAALPRAGRVADEYGFPATAVVPPPPSATRYVPVDARRMAAATAAAYPDQGFPATAVVPPPAPDHRYVPPSARRAAAAAARVDVTVDASPPLPVGFAETQVMK